MGEKLLIAKWVVVLEKESGYYTTIDNRTNKDEYIHRKFTRAWITPETPQNVINSLLKICPEVWINQVLTKNDRSKQKRIGLI